MTDTTDVTDTTGQATDDLDAAIAAEASESVVFFNDGYADSVLLIGRILGDRRDATAAVLTTYDRTGLDLVLTVPEGEVPARIGFPAELTDVGQAGTQAFALVALAREESGEAGLTSAELVMAQTNTIRTFLTSVVRVEDVNPHLKQVTVGGGDLTTFRPLGPDTFLYVLLPPEGRDELTIDQSFTWAGYQEMPEEERPVGAYYTLRRWRPEVAEIDLLFVLHGDDGPASRWAYRAKPGDPVALWGPRTAYEPPADTDWLLLAGDETGLPAISVTLENKPAGLPAEVYVELDGPDNRLPLPDSPEIDVRWIYRGHAEAGTTSLLADAVKARPLRPGNVYAWGGAESRSVTALRKHLRQTCGFDQSRVCMVGYWRHATTPPSEE